MNSERKTHCAINSMSFFKELKTREICEIIQLLMSSNAQDTYVLQHTQVCSTESYQILTRNEHCTMRLSGAWPLCV